MPFLFMKYKILAHSFAPISNWTPTYTLTLMKAALSLRGATGAASVPKPDKTPNSGAPYPVRPARPRPYLDFEL